MSESIRVIFIGTPQFAVPSLRMLYADEEIDIIGVVTKPDSKAGRGMELRPSPVKVLAENLGLSLFQPNSINNGEFLETISELKPHFIVVVAYDEKLGREILGIPEVAPINLHPSLLPDLRGACPINWALIYGYERTGITTIEMNEEYDAGAILYQEVVGIEDEDNAGKLHDRLSDRGAFLLVMTIKDAFHNSITPTPQEKGEYKSAPKFKKEDRVLDWSLPAEDVVNFIRGMTPYPGTLTRLNDRFISITEVVSHTAGGEGESGEITDIKKDGLTVQMGSSEVLIVMLKPEGSSEMRAWDFYNGGGGKVGDVFAGRDEVLQEMGLEVRREKKVDKKVEKRSKKKRRWKGFWRRVWDGDWK